MSDARRVGALWCESELTGSIEIDVQTIPDYVRDELVAPLQAIVTDYFKKPGVEERYQEWLRNRKKTATAAQRKGAKA